MKNPLPTILSSLLALTVCLTSEAQRPRIYDSSDGLPGSRITDIRQDRAGFIWIAGENGLSHFDGKTFRTFRPDGRKGQSLAGIPVHSFFEDSRGTLWVGSSGGLQIFSPEEGHFEDISDRAVTSIIEFTPEEGQRSEIWAGTDGKGILIFDVVTGRPDSLKQTAISSAVRSGHIKKLYSDTGGRVWATFKGGGLCVIDGDTGAVRMPSLPEGISANPLVTDFAEDIESGTILIGTSDAGLLICDSEEETIRRSSDPEARGCNIASLLKDISFMSDGSSFIIGTEGRGLKLFDLRQDKLTDFDGSSLPEGASRWKVRSLMTDRQGNIWAGAYLSGAVVIPKSIYPFSGINMEGDIVSSIYRTQDGSTVWAGTYGNGLVRIGKDGVRTTFNSRSSGLRSDDITALEADRHGSLWIGTGRGLHLLDLSTSSIRPFSNRELPQDIRATDIEYDTERDILYVATDSSGMFALSLRSGKATRAVGPAWSTGITALQMDNDGIVWAGTSDGLLRYDPVTGQLYRDSLTETVRGSHICCLLDGSDGKLWVGTQNGLMSIDKNSGEKSHYGTEDGLPAEIVCSILEDDSGDLWVSTSHGLCRFSVSSGTFERYFINDGLEDDEFSCRAAFAAEDGMLMFGGINGMSFFRPDELACPTGPAAPIILTDLNFSGKDSGRVNITGRNEIVFPGRVNDFTASFSVLEYTNPDNIVCSYRIDRLDREWIRLPSGVREITRTNLPPGRYELRIKAADDNIPSRFSECRTTLTITPPWYRRWWMYVAEGLLLLTALWLVALTVSSRRLLRRGEKETTAKDRKLQMVSDISQEIRIPMTLVMTPLQEMQEKESDPKKKDLYNLMCRNCQRIIRSLNRMSDIQSLDSGELEFHFRETDIVYFVKDILHSFSCATGSRHISIEFRSEKPEQKLWIDQGHFDKIIFNLMSGALKNTPDKGRITVHISAPKEDGNVEISILHDSDRAADIIGTFRDGKESPGLHLAKSLMELHHGQLNVTGTGDRVRFSLLLPCGCGHLSAEEMSPTERHKNLYKRYSVEDETDTATEENGEKDFGSRKTIVVAGIDSEIRSYLKLALRSSYNIRACSDIRNAWGIISTTIPDVVITGTETGGINGIELCAKIKHNPGTNHIPVIILSADNGEEYAEECTRNGADLFLSLPVSLERLRGSLANVISARETIRNKCTNEVHCDYGQLKPESKSAGDFISEVSGIIHRNISNPAFTVADLSREAGISRVHLNRKLKEALNISPGSLIRSIRMKQAAYLLIHNEVSISDVAGHTGFASPSYFTSSFREYFGMTPKEFLGSYRECKDPDTLDRLFGKDWRLAQQGDVTQHIKNKM